MKNPLIFYASEREEWRNWLAANFEKEKEIFGWMDSIIKHLDPLHRIQRFLREKQTRIIDGFGVLKNIMAVEVLKRCYIDACQVIIS